MRTPKKYTRAQLFPARKTCTACEKQKPVASFAIDRAQIDGYCRYCRECIAARYRARVASTVAQRTAVTRRAA
jgi:hypothetical protein